METQETKFRIIFDAAAIPAAPGGAASVPGAPGSFGVPGGGGYAPGGGGVIPGIPGVSPLTPPAIPGSPPPPGSSATPPMPGHTPAPGTPAPFAPGTPGVPTAPGNPSAPVAPGTTTVDSVGPSWGAAIGAGINRGVNAAHTAAATYRSATSEGLYELTRDALDQVVPVVSLRGADAVASLVAEYGPGVAAALNLPSAVREAIVGGAQGFADFRTGIQTSGRTIGQLQDVATAQATIRGAVDEDAIREFGETLYGVQATVARFENARRIRNAQRQGAAVGELAARTIQSGLDAAVELFGGR